MNLRNRPVRVAAAVGAVLAAGTTTVLALTAGTASADEPGRCTQNVNVREDPDSDAKIVALCEAGKAVKLGEERDGFVRLDELNGWAAKDFLKSDGDTATEQSADADQPADDANGSDARSDSAPSDSAQSDSAQSNDAPADDARSGDASDSDDAHSGSAAQGDDNQGGGDQGTTDAPAAGGARPLGGLLG